MIREELNKVLTTNKTDTRRKRYFMWKNKMDNIKIKYSQMTEEEFKEKYCNDKQEWEYLKRWEESEEYKRLLYVLYADNFDNDLLEVYNAVKEEAKKGNSSAVKTFLDLQKEIKKRLKNFDDINTEEKDTELKLDI